MIKCSESDKVRITWSINLRIKLKSGRERSVKKRKLMRKRPTRSDKKSKESTLIVLIPSRSNYKRKMKASDKRLSKLSSNINKSLRKNRKPMISSEEKNNKFSENWLLLKALLCKTRRLQPDSKLSFRRQKRILPNCKTSNLQQTI